jgi:hypothetical protein
MRAPISPPPARKDGDCRLSEDALDSDALRCIGDGSTISEAFGPVRLMRVLKLNSYAKDCLSDKAALSSL